MSNLLHFSQNALRRIGILALLAGLMFAPLSVRLAYAHVFTPGEIPNDCSHFWHRGGGYATITLDSRRFYGSISPDGRYGATPCVNFSSVPVPGTWNVRINGTANRTLRIAPDWGYFRPRSKLACEESNVVYKVWGYNDTWAASTHPALGGGRLYGTWLEEPGTVPGYCTYQPDNPRTPEREPTERTGDSRYVLVYGSAGFTSILVSAHAFSHISRTPIYGSVRVAVSVSP